jgi:hypothetical protein
MLLLRNDFLSTYGAIWCVDKHLNLDEFVACPFRLVPVKWSGQHLRMHIPVLDHTRASFILRLESLAQSGSLCFYVQSRDQYLSRTLPEAGPSGRRS